MLHLKTAKLARWQIWLLCLSGGILWATGVAWLLLHYYGRTEGEFGPETNPAEPWMLRLHGAALIAMLLAAGSLLVVHVWRGWNYRSQRFVGLLLTGVTAVLTLSGYLLYYVGEDSFRSWTSVVHWGLGLVGLPLFVIHYRMGKAIRRS